MELKALFFLLHHRDRSLMIPDVLLHNSWERQNTPLNLEICHFYVTRKRMKKNLAGVKCIAVAFEFWHVVFLYYYLFPYFMTIWPTDAHPQSLAAFRWCKKDMKINKNLPQTRRAWIFKRLYNLWKHMQIDKANKTREDYREWRLSVVYLFFNRLHSLHVDALIGAHPAEICSSQNQSDWATGEKPQPPEPPPSYHCLNFTPPHTIMRSIHAH